MFEVGTFVVYKNGICKIKEIRKNYFKDSDYYILSPMNDLSLTLSVPVNDNNNFRNIISKEEVERLINSVNNIEIISIENDKFIENEYKMLLKSGKHEDLIKIIKTTYLRNNDRLENGKKISEKDNTYFIKAEHLLYNEFSIVLGMNYDDTKEYVVNKVAAQ